MTLFQGLEQLSKSYEKLCLFPEEFKDKYTIRKLPFYIIFLGDIQEFGIISMLQAHKKVWTVKDLMNWYDYKGGWVIESYE